MVHNVENDKNSFFFEIKQKKKLYIQKYYRFLLEALSVQKPNEKSIFYEHLKNNINKPCNHKKKIWL